MFTSPDELFDLQRVREMKCQTAEEYEKLQKARDEDFTKRCNSFVKFIRRIFKKKIS